MTTRGYLQEVFASFQGEGTRVGERHVFVRTAGCSLRCRYCDTPLALVRTESVRVHRGAGEPDRELNPVTPDQAAAWVEELDREQQAWVSWTGGEPLEQAEFLAEMRPLLGARRVYLETAGVNALEMGQLASCVDFVSFDLKLDSVSKEGDRRAEHREFLRACQGIERMAKVVVNEHTDRDELESMARLVAESDSAIPFVLQPETPRRGRAPRLPQELLEDCFRRARRHLPNVRLIPQTHRFLELP